jgi:hypothetical protein
MDEQMHKRANFVRVHLDNLMLYEQVIDVALPAKLDPWSAAIICMKAVHAKQELLFENEHLAFSEFVEYLKKLVAAANESRTESDMNKRFISMYLCDCITIVCRPLRNRFYPTISVLAAVKIL